MSGKYALIIGNTEYIDPGLAQLSAPGKDAGDFAQVLKDQDVCAFDRVFTLINRDILTVNQAIEDFFTRKKPDDLLLLYFSGHGVRDENGALYLAVKNTNRARLRSTAVRSDFIREAMDQGRSKRQVLILDCCNSGAFAKGTKSATDGSMGAATAFEGKGYGHIVLTATDAIQFAWEGDKVIRGDTSNSLFTHFLIKGLEGEADQDGDGKITVDDLYDYAYEQTINTTSKQTPGKWSYGQQGEIILRQSLDSRETRPQPLPTELINAIDSPLPYVREGAVRQLEELLKGKNIRLAQSAREALEKIVSEDDSTRVSMAAKQAMRSASRLIQEAQKNDRLPKREVLKQKQQNKNAAWVKPTIIGGSVLLLSLCAIASSTLWSPFLSPLSEPSITPTDTTTPAIQTEVLAPAIFASTQLPTLTLEPTQTIPTMGMNIVPTDTETATLPTSTEQIFIPETGTQRENPTDGATLMYIPSGKFTMGLTTDQFETLRPLCDGILTCEELLQNSHVYKVELADFWVYQTEVSNANYTLCVNAGECTEPQPQNAAFTSNNNYYANPGFSNYPVVWVSWMQAKKYCNWAGGELPTSAQWEYAARGADGRLFPWGDTFPDPSRANVNNFYGQLKEVNDLKDYPSPFGLLNTSGNVWEWTLDWYYPNFYDPNITLIDPLVDSNENNVNGSPARVVRGGSAWFRSALASVAVQDWEHPDQPNFGIGFRCVQSLL